MYIENEGYQMPTFVYNSVVQLLLTYGPFYKNVTISGPLPTN